MTITPKPEPVSSVTAKQMRRRLFKSIFTGLVFFTALAFGFQKIQNAPEDDAISVTLRKAFHFNENIWSRLHTNARTSPELPQPPAGKAPRVNGDLGLSAPADIEHYEVVVESGDKKLNLPISAFKAMPKVGYTNLFKCIEGWSETVQYAGVGFSKFMETYQVGKKPDGSYYKYVGLETPDKEYYVSIDIESMMHSQTVLAYEMNEQPLDLKNGAPLRLVIPVKYGIKNIKRIGRIFFSDTKPADYWAENGYDWWSGL
jgi:DMSO/TMAO reductase YedYZ molybdopterin-dependent catalytic subunit